MANLKPTSHYPKTTKLISRLIAIVHPDFQARNLFSLTNHGIVKKAPQGELLKLQLSRVKMNRLNLHLLSAKYLKVQLSLRCPNNLWSNLSTQLMIKNLRNHF